MSRTTATTSRSSAAASEVWYGHLVEFGTRYVPAQPFLVPAAEEGKEEPSRPWWRP